LADSFPALTETFVLGEVTALASAGHRVRVEAAERCGTPAPRPHPGVEVSYLEDDHPARRLVDAAWLSVRHPLRSAHDLRERRRWRTAEEVRPLRSLAPAARRLARGGERHLHAHFAAGAALDSLRLARLLGISYSVTAHGYDIFRAPRNLREKLECAAFATSGCDYNVRHLRRVGGRRHARRIHKLVMGVDGGRFERSLPYPGGRRVVAIGRLVEKKGFRHLVDAAALLRETAPLEALQLVGDGELRDALRDQIARHGLEDTVELCGALEHDEVRELLHGADLLAAPCVIARDGDRDSMPVAVKEALAMEVPVVATEEVGLPEMVRPEWGVLVPPADPRALADAIDAVLGLPVEARVRMGRAGRAWVLNACSLERQAERLAELVAASGAEPEPAPELPDPRPNRAATRPRRHSAPRPRRDPELPSFLVIGAMHAGTARLHSCLRAHPDVFMPIGSELDFFLDSLPEHNWRRGLDWYRARFARAGGALALGEGSSGYTKHPMFPGAAERIREVLPEARLIYLVRDPIERMRDHYADHAAARGRSGPPIGEALLSAPSFRLCSSYALQLDAYLDHFPAEQLLVVTVEDLRDRRAELLPRVFEFIGVDPAFSPPALPEPNGARATAGSVRPRDTRIPEVVESRLRELLAPDVMRLRRFLGPGFDGWGIA
jgi:glycosyltransferase involved in cell wall biosynthesis